MDNELFWLWLCNIEEMCNGSIRKLFTIIDSPKNLYELPQQEVKDLCNELCLKEGLYNNIIYSRNFEKISKLKNNLDKKGIRFLSIEHKEFPKRLKNISDCPYGIYIKGQKPDFERPSVAVVGARNCTNYGIQISYKIGFELAANGINVISGMARGIDSQSHWGAIDACGITYAVMGCGVDVCYPKDNIGLYENIQKYGGIISEYPCNSKPLGWRFPLRNRIISGMADKIVIVEAKEKSGSLITVDYALEQGKDVYAVPGRIEEELSKGSNRLIKEGAGLIYSVESLIQDLDFEVDRNSKILKNKNIILEKDLETLYNCLDLFPKHVEQLISETGKNSVEILRDLIKLEMMGLITEPSKNYYSKKI